MQWLRDNPDLVHLICTVLGAVAGYLLKRSPNVPPELADVLKLLAERQRSRQQRQAREQLQDLVKDA